MKLFSRTSFYGLLINGFLTLIILFILINKWQHDKQIDINTIILFAILVGIHSLLHLGYEINYQYNPISYITN
jgi:hypothetical protein